MKIMNKSFFLQYYLELFNLSNSIIEDDIIKLAELIMFNSNYGGKVIVIGNGGSASISSHITVDLIKAAGIEAVNFNEPSLITCFANDYGYEKWVQEALKIHCKPNDVVIIISSSGMSLNLINGMKEANSITKSTISFTGFEQNNDLSKLGLINFWVDSKVYNYIEITHQTWLLSMIDYIIKIKKKS